MSEAALQRDRRPLPLQLRDHLLDLVRSDGLRPGDQLPPEPDLSRRFGVGRSTVREAIKLLERDGVVEVVHGRGSFVSAMADLGAERPITRFESVTDMMEGLGYTVENRVLSVREREPSPEERAELRLGDDDTVVELERLRLHDGKPFVYSVNVLARDLFPEQAVDEIDWSASVIDLLDTRGHRVVSSAAHIRATDPPALAGDADPAPGGPWLLITETCVTAAGRYVLYARDYHRGDVFAFHVVRRRPAGA